MPSCYSSKRKGGRGIMVKKGKSGCGIKRMFRDGLAGLGKNAEKVKDDVAPRMKKATEAFKKFDGLQIDTSKGKPKKYISLNF
jgi:hypothetical protein